MKTAHMLAAVLVSAAAIGMPHASAQTANNAPREKCLRALDGSCTKPAIVEATRLRSAIVPSVRVSYLGTPAGTIGGNYIYFERFFQDNPTVFGLPTSTCTFCNVVTRTK